MVTRENLELQFGDVVSANVEMIQAILDSLDPEAEVSVAPVPDEDAVRVTVVFPESVTGGACIDTQKLAELRATVAGFDTHLVEVTADFEHRRLAYDMLSQTKVTAAQARERGLFHRTTTPPEGNHAGVHVASFVDPEELSALAATLSPLHTRTVIDAIEGYTKADELANEFQVRVRESQGHLCEVILVGVSRVHASTCIALTRSTSMRCIRVHAEDGQLRLTVDTPRERAELQRALASTHDTSKEPKSGSAPRFGWLLRLGRRMWGGARRGQHA